MHIHPKEKKEGSAKRLKGKKMQPESTTRHQGIAEKLGATTSNYEFGIVEIDVHPLAATHSFNHPSSDLFEGFIP